jgi:hypothetical protein
MMLPFYHRNPLESAPSLILAPSLPYEFSENHLLLCTSTAGLPSLPRGPDGRSPTMGPPRRNDPFRPQSQAPAAPVDQPLPGHFEETGGVETVGHVAELQAVPQAMAEIGEGLRGGREREGGKG